MRQLCLWRAGMILHLALDFLANLYNGILPFEDVGTAAAVPKVMWTCSVQTCHKYLT